MQHFSSLCTIGFGSSLVRQGILSYSWQNVFVLWKASYPIFNRMAFSTLWTLQWIFLDQLSRTFPTECMSTRQQSWNGIVVIDSIILKTHRAIQNTLQTVILLVIIRHFYEIMSYQSLQDVSAVIIYAKFVIFVLNVLHNFCLFVTYLPVKICYGLQKITIAQTSITAKLLFKNPQNVEELFCHVIGEQCFCNIVGVRCTWLNCCAGDHQDRFRYIVSYNRIFPWYHKVGNVLYSLNLKNMTDRVIHHIN